MEFKIPLSIIQHACFCCRRSVYAEPRPGLDAYSEEQVREDMTVLPALGGQDEEASLSHLTSSSSSSSSPSSSFSTSSSSARMRRLLCATSSPPLILSHSPGRDVRNFRGGQYGIDTETSERVGKSTFEMLRCFNFFILSQHNCSAAGESSGRNTGHQVLLL